jgi:hypothetical protein
VIDVYSSAPYFTGFAELADGRNPSNCHARASPVEPARSWLLARGWSRYGYISVREAPSGRAGHAARGHVAPRCSTRKPTAP